ncbi:glycosyl hydrolase [Paenibacillus lentus]|uniref:Glycosyl hydrolase n=2 Tax=Paenibacillus lentus TaxID=1338368 RepID=A0A3Q8S791_9BACL|nr:glycosyl hydrolase family 8 [Paenibacillus lentus]AZK48871.1 glycosyl hydrolase [Paenibacillus lentus]
MPVWRNSCKNLLIISTIILSTIILLGCSIAVSTYSGEAAVKNERPYTEKFITKHMTNTNGTLATYLKPAISTYPDIVAGREALSESLGFWMQYAVMRQDHALFDRSYQVLKDKFLTPEKYIVWKLEPDGRIKVNTNALGDDLRIIGSLLEASELWKKDEYLTTAKEISDTLQRYVQKEGYFVDFHDFARHESPSTLSLVYVDIGVLKLMRDRQLVDSGVYEQYAQVLSNMPDDGIFYPKTFDVQQLQYTFDDHVNLIDQLIVGIHLAAMDEPPTALISFLKQEFRQYKTIKGRYNRVTRTAEVSYESPSVYGLAILLALESEDKEWAKQLHKHMITLKNRDASYSGGYVFNKNTHFFDNVLPLLAETALQNP